MSLPHADLLGSNSENSPERLYQRQRWFSSSSHIFVPLPGTPCWSISKCLMYDRLSLRLGWIVWMSERVNENGPRTDYKINTHFFQGWFLLFFLLWKLYTKTCLIPPQRALFSGVGSYLVQIFTEELTLTTVDRISGHPSLPRPLQLHHKRENPVLTQPREHTKLT